MITVLVILEIVITVTLRNICTVTLRDSTEGAGKKPANPERHNVQGNVEHPGVVKNVLPEYLAAGLQGQEAWGQERGRSSDISAVSHPCTSSISDKASENVSHRRIPEVRTPSWAL